MRRGLAAVAVLTAVYALALASADPVDLMVGALAAAAVVAVFRRIVMPGQTDAVASPARARLLATPGFVLAVLRDIAAGTWDVALVVCHLRPLRSPGIVAVPIGARTPRGVVVTALVATLSPGEFLVDVDRDRGVLLMHVLDASDPDAVRARHRDFYERYQRGVFP